ncbi:MAG: CinA family nicotinamide mononucleotide deamidase-related protein [bacterium]|nr:CinA family nicotinamide mononucleotide deamidase-related protein [bacterium]
MSAPEPKTAQLVAIGDELVHGSALDTNSKWLAGELERLGLVVRRLTVVGDDPDHLEQTIAAACAHADVVVATGGLGPTLDDRTREVVARILGVELEFHEPSWEHVRNWLTKRRRPVPESNRRQAMLPTGGEVLANTTGTAPGFAITIERARLFALPGVPREMRTMFSDHVRPAVAALDGLQPTTDLRLLVLGPSEAALGERLGDHMLPGRNPAVGVTASGGLLTVRIVATAPELAAAEALCEATAAELRPLLGDWLFAEGRAELPELVLARLRQLGHTLALAESCTGGQIAARLVASAGASDVLRGGIVAYHNDAKVDLLGVEPDLLAEHGAVSEPVVSAMAAGARERLGADLAAATSGIAGPGGGSAEKPVGTVCFALATPTDVRAWTLRIPDLGREFVRDRAVFEVFRALLQ